MGRRVVGRSRGGNLWCVWHRLWLVGLVQLQLRLVAHAQFRGGLQRDGARLVLNRLRAIASGKIGKCEQFCGARVLALSYCVGGSRQGEGKVKIALRDLRATQRRSNQRA